jgi:uncharacterized protein YggE
MNRVAVVVGVFAGLVAGASRLAGAEEGDRARLITVTSTGEVQVKPDVARVLLTVAGQASSVTETQAAHDKLLAELKGKLTAKLGDKGSVEVAALDIRPVQTNYAGTSASPATVGYRVTSQVDVVTDLTQLSTTRLAELAQVAIDVGAMLRTVPNVNSYGRYSGQQGPSFVLFELKDPSKHKLEALRRAVQEAGPRAKTVAEALGAKLGKVQSVQIGAERVYTSRQPYSEADAASADQWTDVVVASTVTVNYAAEF